MKNVCTVFPCLAYVWFQCLELGSIALSAVSKFECRILHDSTSLWDQSLRLSGSNPDSAPGAAPSQQHPGHKRSCTAGLQQPQPHTDRTQSSALSNDPQSWHLAPLQTVAPSSSVMRSKSPTAKAVKKHKLQTVSQKNELPWQLPPTKETQSSKFALTLPPSPSLAPHTLHAVRQKQGRNKSSKVVPFWRLALSSFLLFLPWGEHLGLGIQIAQIAWWVQNERPNASSRFCASKACWSCCKVSDRMSSSTHPSWTAALMNSRVLQVRLELVIWKHTRISTSAMKKSQGWRPMLNKAWDNYRDTRKVSSQGTEGLFWSILDVLYSRVNVLSKCFRIVFSCGLPELSSSSAKTRWLG